MGLVNRNILYHSFYCPICGNKAMDLPREVGHQRKKHHRKKLYCTRCRRTANCIECRTPSEVEEFQFDFLKGVYKKEAELALENTYIPTGLME